MIENFLTTEQVANILQVHPFTILKFIKQGKLRGVKLGRVYRIKESDVHEFLESRMTGAKTHNPQLHPENHTLIEHLESQESDRNHAHDQRHSYDPTPYNIRRDDNDEMTPPHYII